MRSCFKVLFVAIVFVGCSKSSITYTNNPNAPEYLHNRPVGASANEFLSSTKYNSIKIEVQYMTGFAPDASALSHLQSVLSSVVNKPSGISITTKEVTAATNPTFSINDVSQFEQHNRASFTTGDQIAVYILYTNGYNTDNRVLGAAYWNTSIVIFGKNIHDNSGGVGQVSRYKLEATTLEHEFGHLLGLVDLGSPMQTNHKDAAHGNHCSNSNCLMYYASDTHDMLGLLISGNIPTFDANCLADLHANGGK